GKNGRRFAPPILTYLAVRTNQTPRIDWRHEAPPVNSWGLCPSTFADSYIGKMYWYWYWYCGFQMSAYSFENKKQF
ncbi:hypothetical protein, partial [Pseudanabaena sp. UWO310]|uniref:hypothetical protein n=1 Tax=Pseudanabaena sp. UWO310 TaxID=2480795 RepID=UPI001CC1F112